MVSGFKSGRLLYSQVIPDLINVEILGPPLGVGSACVVLKASVLACIKQLFILYFSLIQHIIYYLYSFVFYFQYSILFLNASEDACF